MLISAQKFRRSAIALMTAALLITAVGCSDSEEDASNNEEASQTEGTLDLGVQANLDDLCADPAQYDGRAVTFAGSMIEEVSVSTTAGCTEGMQDGCCGNAVWMTFTIPCGEDALVLVAAPGANFPVAQGRVDYAAGTEREELITNSSTSFGCVGQECALECTPGSADELANLSATFRFDSSVDAFSGPTEEGGDGAYRLELEVSEATLNNQ